MNYIDLHSYNWCFGTLSFVKAIIILNYVRYYKNIFIPKKQTKTIVPKQKNW